MSRVSEAKSYQSRGRLSQAPEPSTAICRDSIFFFSVRWALELCFANLYRSGYLGKVTWKTDYFVCLRFWNYGHIISAFRGAQNLDLLWGVILIEICAWRLSFWNPDTDRNLPWQHFIATSTDTIVVLMPCHHSSFSNWKAKKMPKMFLRRVIFFSKKSFAWLLICINEWLFFGGLGQKFCL